MSDYEPQKLIVYNKYLPYGIDNEAVNKLAEIKYNLARAVIFQEVTPGVLLWCNRLVLYLRLNGRNFCKEDHVLFIKLLFRLLTMPDMEPQFVKGFALILRKLMKKRDLITADDLKLPWKPLYELVKHVRHSKLVSCGLEKFPSKYLEIYIIPVVALARSYFTVESTEEMLLEFRPLMCPLDSVKADAAFYFSKFLPTRIPQEFKEKTYKLWLEELMEYWIYSTSNFQNIAEDYVKLFYRLSEGNVGYIDWTSYMTQIIDTFLGILNLPINGKKTKFTSMKPSIYHAFAGWFVFMMGGQHGNVVLNHLEKLFVALKSFYYPSNHGKHTYILQGFLRNLVDTFVRRLHNERFHKPTWLTTIPEHVHINDNEIERFVVMVKDVAFLSIFSKSGSLNAAFVLQNLALLRADLILPSLLDRTFEALETLVEPHQVTATLACITSVARTLVTGGDHLPSAPTHILPLLRLVLPGIDPNDFSKSMCAFTFISAMASLVPFVDCMPAVHAGLAMSEVEKELCLASGQLEDVVLQFIDRCFVMVENSTSESISEQDTLVGNAVNIQENLMTLEISSTMQAVLMQCSTPIFKSALNCLFSFVSTRVLEVKVAGRMVSDICRSAARARPEITLKKLLPYISNCIKNLASTEGVETEEHVDPELLWYLEMLSELVRCDGKCLLVYQDVLKEVLRQTLHLKCKKAYLISAKLLKSILSSLSEVYTLEWRSISESLDQSPLEHFYIRDWGKPGDVNDLNVQWHVSSEEEMKFLDELLSEFLVCELDVLDRFMDGSQSLTRDQLHQRLQIVSVCICGAATLLPVWKDEIVEDLATPSMVSRDKSVNIVLPNEMQSFVCCISRKQIADRMHKFFDFMLKKHEDDTKSFQMIVKMYGTLLLHHGVHWDTFNARWKSKNTVKRALADKLHGNKRHIRAVQVERVQLQHDMRVLDQQSTPLCYAEKVVLDDLTIMAMSDYTEVRMSSQRALFGCLEVFESSNRSILPLLLDNIKQDSSVSHEKLKGTLYVLQSSRMVQLMSHYWKPMLSSWLLIVQANKSEKPSIVSLINQLIKRIQGKYETLRIDRKIDQDCIDAAEDLLKTETPIPRAQGADATRDDSVLPSQEYLNKAQEMRLQTNKENREQFYTLEKDLCSLLLDSSMHWRCLEMSVSLLQLLLNNEVKCSLITVETYLKLLVNDSLALRQAATKGISGFLHQYKPEFEKVALDYSKFGIIPRKDVLLSLLPGDNRDDNKWLQYEEARAFTSQKDLNECVFVDKTHWGYQMWPTELKVYVHQEDFYKNNREREKLVAVDVKMLDSLCNEQFLEKFFSFFSMEVKKGEDKFRHKHFVLFKSIFRNYGAVVLNHWKANITQLLSENVESKHRLATEIIAGLIRGSKNWNYADLTDMWDFLLPLLKNIFASNVMQETSRDWAHSMILSTESLDPNRFHRLFHMLAENPLNGDGGSQGDANRLYILQNTFAQQEWRMAGKLHTLLQYTLTHLTHPFKNVRDRIGSTLSYFFVCDLKYGGYTPSLSPTVEIFIDHVIKDLAELCRSVLEQHDDDAIGARKDSAEETMQVDGEGGGKDTSNHVIGSHDDNERKRKDRLAKTVLAYLASNAYSFQSMNKNFFRILPLLLPLESRDDDPEIVSMCRATFPALAVKQLPPDLITTAVSTLIQVCGYKSWSARKSGLNYLKLMIFHNLFALDDEKIKEDLSSMLIERLKDEQVEVREIASTLFSGLVHYGYFQVTPGLMDTFHTMAKTKVKKKKHGIELSTADLEKNINALQMKHGGVLGLSALVMAFPYDVEAWMPEVIIDLGNYLHGLPQITSTAKKALSEFRRTHHDNWLLHRQKFTDDQLAVLTDLLISPSYYA